MPSVPATLIEISSDEETEQPAQRRDKGKQRAVEFAPLTRKRHQDDGEEDLAPCKRPKLDGPPQPPTMLGTPGQSHKRPYGRVEPDIEGGVLVGTSSAVPSRKRQKTRFVIIPV